MLENVKCLSILYLLLLCNHGNAQSIVKTLVNEAVASAANSIPNTTNQRVPQIGRRGPKPAKSSIDLLNLFSSSQNQQQLRRSSRVVLITEKAVSSVNQRLRKMRAPAVQPTAIYDLVEKAVESFCDEREQISCDKDASYRTIDGTCNNLQNKLTGAAFTPQSRFLEPTYGDPNNFGSVPRIKGKNGEVLKSPRVISNAVLKSEQSAPQSNRFTVALTHFGQFVDHDIVATPIFSEPDGTSISCCNGNEPVKRDECFSFSTPKDEFKFTCMHFVRSLPASSPGCSPGPRNQMNVITSYLDLSSVYGSSKERLDQLRKHENGELAVGDNDLLPNTPPGAPEECKRKCFIAGDKRHSEVPLLAMFHIIFVREHNRIAKKLSDLNTEWKDEKLFQETRKILTGVYQHIVFNEFVTALVGPKYANIISLTSSSKGYQTFYSPYLDGSSRNEFGATAFRYGHSQVGNHVGASGDDFKELRRSLMQNESFDVKTIRDPENKFGVKRMGRWMSATLGDKTDRFISDQMRNHLFEVQPGEAFDLGALNTQRGRDHGIAGYNEYREYCGLYRAKHFGNAYGGLVDHDKSTARALSEVYSHPDDIDLFVGGISEKPASGESILGPTFRCLIALQFLNYKHGDRFFYENKFPATGFTLDQLNEIKRQTFAGIYCRTLSLEYIQPNIFINPDSQKPPVKRIRCDELPRLNLDYWKT
ncbi:peroxidase-like protein [Mytilus edulis]|uniref:peroxidase-like protein n=1 Tax=Mytilus edulis TaxID=6550 RepID=UPI0039F126B4